MTNLLVIPSVDIKDGKTVRIVQGIPELNCSEYGNDPVMMAKIWRAENAKMLHITDFDGAIEHSAKNLNIIKEICKSVVIPIEFAGGVRNLEEAKTVFELGISRLAVTTVAIEDQEEFEKILNHFGTGKIVVALDIINDEIVTRGRKTKTGIKAIDIAKKLKKTGVERFIVTDIEKNGMLLGPNIQLAKKIALAVKAKITISGGVRNKDELMDIKELIPLGVDSIIVGRALYENRFPCQKVWRIAESGIFN